MPPISDTRRIRRLPEDVVNRIAAGEVVCRPSAALKELIENALDAGATAITVNVREGGLKLLQVTDNGKGIPYEDLPLLCERFATSKISSYEDLEQVCTFGFRGEALASMSHVSRLTVLTKTRGSTVAFKASYLASSMRESPEATAGVNGTTITLEEMFYNLPTRRRALKSSSDEYRLVLDVVTRYAIHYPQVSFVCKRQYHGSASRVSSSSDFRTDLNSTVTDNIRTAFGSSLCQETLCIEVDVRGADASLSAVVSTSNYSLKKGIFILFINGRLVECQPFKRAVWTTYSCFLPKNSFPFAYIALKMRPTDLDVNVHPTKKEVRFLHENLIIDAFVEELNCKLKGTETSRTFLAQSVITLDPHQEPLETFVKSDGLGKPHDQCDRNGQDGFGIEKEVECTKRRADITPIPAIGLSSSLDTRKVFAARRNGFDSHLVAALDDAEAVSKIDVSNTKRSKQSFFKQSAVPALSPGRPSSTTSIVHPKDKIRTGANAPVGLYDVFLMQNTERNAAVDIQAKRRRRTSAMPLLTSVENLLNETRRGCHKGLSQVLKEHLFVGIASNKHALLQHGTKLLLANIDSLLVELMYQQVLIKFADFDTFRLNPPAPVSRLLNHYALNIPETAVEARIDPESCIAVLIEKAGMLSEYFGIQFRGNCSGTFAVEQLPILFPQVIPNIKLLGSFLYHLVVDTDWSAEEPCFSDVSRRIAEWYGKDWTPLRDTKGDQYQNTGMAGKDSASSEMADGSVLDTTKRHFDRREWLLRHVLFAAMRSDFYVPRRFLVEEVLREVTSTSRLYKVFERC